MGRRALLILNRKSCRGRADLGEALERLRTGGVSAVEECPGRPDDIPEMIRAQRGKVEAVVIGGGDGTLNAAAQGLIDTGLPLGILPLGTANDLARTLGIPTDLTAAAEVIAAGHERRIDLGRVNGRYFFNVAGLGLSVQITKALSRETKSRWGVLAYLFAALKVLVTARPFTVEIRGDDEVRTVRTVQITVGNGRYYGGGMAVDQNADIDDERLHLYSLEIDRWWQIIPLLPALRKGTLADSPRVRTWQGREFVIRPLSHGRPVNADGEITGRTPAHFQVVPKALSVLVPRPSPE